jgi:GH35 family endo-1,4-beta-xylanase
MKKTLWVAALAGLLTGAVTQGDEFYQSDLTGADLASAGLASSTGLNGYWALDTIKDRVRGVRTTNNPSANLYTTNSWQSVDGFALNVTFKRIASGARFSFGIVDAAWVVSDSTDWLNGALTNAYGVGFASDGELVGLTGGDALGFNNGSEKSVLSTNQNDITLNAIQTLSFTVRSNSWSYSLNGQTATTGSFTFDTSRSFRFIAHAQDVDAAYFSNIALTTEEIPSIVPSTESPLPDGRRLRTIVADKYPAGNVYIGSASGWGARPYVGVISDREFNYVTPENDYKQSTVHPEPGIWNWVAGDAWVNNYTNTQQVIRLHGPISPQCSTWAQDTNRTAAELQQNMTEHMTELCKRYDKFDHVKWMDVVNETARNTSWQRSPAMPWTLIGYDESDPLIKPPPPLYIKMAFQIANQWATNTELIINQNTDPGTDSMKMVQDLVPYLRRQGLRVDGLGWQAHVDTGWEKNSTNMMLLHELIDWCHENQLSFHVTEMNSWLKTVKDYEAQAQTFAAILSALLEHRENGVVSWNVWNVTDGYAWQPLWEGTLFDAAGKAKPAYYAVQNVLENPPPPRKVYEVNLIISH